MKRITLFLLLVAGAPCAVSQSQPTLFVPGVVPTPVISNAAPAFTPDGSTVYFGQSAGGSDEFIVVSHLRQGQWTSPRTASFSGHFRDLEPAFAPDGNYLVFASNRPATPGGQVLTGHYNGRVLPEAGGHLWKVVREGQHWGKPQPLPAVINSNSSIFSPALTADGTLYFMRADNGGGFHVYRAAMKNGQYATPVLAPFSDPVHGEFDPAVAADESFVIFCSPRPPAPPHTSDLFIVFRTSGGWSAPLDLRTVLGPGVYGIEARLSPNGKTLYFANDRGPGGISIPKHRFVWQADLTKLLASHGRA